jgi:hypothetical protein
MPSRRRMQVSTRGRQRSCKSPNPGRWTGLHREHDLPETAGLPPSGSCGPRRAPSKPIVAEREHVPAARRRERSSAMLDIKVSPAWGSSPLQSREARRRNSESGRPGCRRGAIACRRNHRPVEAIVAAQLEPDGGRSRLPSRRSRASTDAAAHRHAVPLTDVIVFDLPLPLRDELDREVVRRQDDPYDAQADRPDAARLGARRACALAPHEARRTVRFVIGGVTSPLPGGAAGWACRCGAQARPRAPRCAPRR